MFIYLLEFPGRNPAVYKSFRDATQAAELAMWSTDHKHWMFDNGVWIKHQIKPKPSLYWHRPMSDGQLSGSHPTIWQLEVKEFAWGTPIKDARRIAKVRECKPCPTD